MRIILFAILISQTTFSFSQSLKKGQNAINRGRYDIASTELHGVLKQDGENPAAQFLLAKMYLAKDYAGFNLDSANKYIMKSAQGLKKDYKEKDLENLQSSGWREFTVKEMQDQINAAAYKVAD